MGYLHIDNLYRNQDILLFKECYALEKVHGTSAHIGYRKTPVETISFFSGGVSPVLFEKLFDKLNLANSFSKLGHNEIKIYGEAYGGSCQGMKETYGINLQFIAFDVQIGDLWLSVPDMAQICNELCIEIVPYEKISTEIATLDTARDKPSVVAERKGCGTTKRREGVVLRPLVEMTTNRGRVIAKHKTEEFSERATPQKVITTEKLGTLKAAEAIANEWVTEMRLTHVLDKLNTGGSPASIEDTRKVLDAMVEDVYREAKGEIVESRETATAIGKRTALMFKERCKQSLTR